ncbi:MAG: PadR family transcriptional regulator [Tenericutes bacterium]|nr:PadR family transcriptional regulator [Mycoplasmatota bacterium]
MNSQFKRGIIELCVLKELVPEDMYGYMIINNLSEYLNVNDNTIYPILRRLTKEGYFTTYLKESSSGAPRKYYRITKKGFEHYINLRDEWDQFIGGVYVILNKGGKKNEEVYEKIRRRIEQM